MEFIYIFLLFGRRIEGGASQSGPLSQGLRLQWNLPELAATPASVGWSSERPHLKRSRGAHTQVGNGLASLLAYQSLLRTGGKRLKGEGWNRGDRAS